MVQEAPMSRFPSKSFHCEVISEAVSIVVRRRTSLGTRGKLFVQCTESDCQYAGVNEPPCPLTLDIFAAELRERMLST
jgi:hypothetical protein